MAKPVLAAIGAIFIVGGGAALGFAVTRKATGGMTQDETRAMDSAISQLDGDLKAARTAVAEHASDLAGIIQVRAAVSADAKTARDQLAEGDLLKAKAGEIVEIGQVAKAGDPAEPPGGFPGELIPPIVT